MHRLALLVVIGCSSEKPETPPESKASEVSVPAPVQHRKYSCVDLLPEGFRAYRAVKPESDRFGMCQFNSQIDADEVKCYVSVVCEPSISAEGAEEKFKQGTLATAPVKLEGVGTVGFTDQRKPKSLMFMVVDEKVDCYVYGIVPPGTDVKALASDTLRALAKRP
jgi:hypothetical protein